MSVGAKTAFNQYRNMQINTASPEKLVLMLYDGAIKNIRIAEEALGESRYSDANNALVKAQDIINELASSLDMSQEISANLYQLYDFVRRVLIEANIKKSSENLDPVKKILTDLRDAWAEVAKT